MLTVLLFLTTLAFGAGPDRQAASLSVGTGEVRSLSASSSGELLAFAVGSQAAVLDLATFSVTTVSPCSVTSAALVEGVGDGLEAWIGCADGRVLPHSYRDGAFAPITDLGDGGSIQALERRIHGLRAGAGTAGVSRVYAMGLDQATDQLRIAVIDPANASITQAIPLIFEGYGTSALAADFLYVLHGDAFISAINVNSGLPTQSLGGGVTRFVSATPTARGSALVVSRRDDGIVAEFSGFTNIAAPVVSPAPGVRAVGNLIGASEVGYVLLAFNDRAEVWAADQGAIRGSSPERSFALDDGATHATALSTGYALVGTSGGRLLVLTDKPWLDQLELSTDSPTSGEELQISFRSDEPGDLTVALGGSLAGGGVPLAQGTATVGTNTLRVPVADWPEGANRLFVRLTTSDGRIGHIAARVEVDAAPRAVSLTPGSVAFSDRSLTLAFAPLSSDGIASYRVYLTTVPFTAEEWPEGGPAYEGPDDVTAPIDVAAEGQDTIRVTFSPLTNEMSYYLAVRAIDSDGQEGPMSQVVEGRPRPTQSAAQLAGETGGWDCNNLGVGGVGFGLLALAGAALRRRRRIAPALLGAALVGALAATPAHAVEDEDDDGIDDRLQVEDRANRDLTSAWGNFEVRYGVITLRDENLTRVYGAGGNNVLFLEIGPQIYRFLELDLGAGFFQELAFTVDAQGNPGSQRTMITAIPLAVTPVLRAHFLDEQFLVPYAGLGMSWWMWNEKVDNAAGGKDTISGSKFGWHWSVGLNLLLDTFSRSRASMLEAQTGINDSWFTIEFRRQVIEGDQGIFFSGDVITAGLKLDF
jgi:hypothetical protein